MARPLKDGLTYFQHDVNMSADEKLEALEAVHGNDGYAVYNKLLERIYKSFGKLDLSDDVQRLSIAKKCNVSVEKFEAILADALRFRLFDREPWEIEKRLTSERIRAQLETVEEEREEWRKKHNIKKDTKSELSPEQTPVIPGANPGYPDGKVHQAEQSRAEQSNKELAGGLLVDNFSKVEEAELYAFALERARKNPKNKYPSSVAKRIMHEPDVVADFRASRPSASPSTLIAPEPSPCVCGEPLKANCYIGAARCMNPKCGKTFTFDADFNQWFEDNPEPIADTG
jgi:hypothetical protein